MSPQRVAVLSGLLFGAGLTISEMTNPARVIGFLDVAGPWDPTLAFVIGGALFVSAVAVRVERRRSGPQPVGPSGASGLKGIDSRLLSGAALFGVGWGLAGFCPGPALAALATGSWKVLLFVASMMAGMGLFELTAKPGATDTRRASAAGNA